MFTGPNIVRDGLVLAFDSANVRSYPGVASTIYDMSGNGNHGSKVNSPSIVNDFTEGGQLNYTLVDWSGGHPSNEAGLDAIFNQGTPATGIHSTSLAWGNGGQAIRWGGNVSGYPSYHNKTVYYGWQVEGYIYMSETGTYSFQVDGDDAIDFFIGGHKCAYWYGGHGFGSGGTGTSRFYRRGWYTFKARMEEQGGGDGIAVGWNKPSDSGLSTIPIEYCATSIPNTKKNRRIDFDGTNDYIVADLPSINSAHTVMLWIYANNGLPTITGDATGRVTPLKGNGHWNPGIWLGNNKIRGHAATKYSDYTGISWSAAAWHLIGQVYNGTSLDLIVDGEVVTPTSTTNYSPGVPSQVLIGIENIGTSTTAFDGKISNVQIFDRALTSSEVRRYYNATKGRFS